MCDQCALSVRGRTARGCMNLARECEFLAHRLCTPRAPNASRYIFIFTFIYLYTHTCMYYTYTIYIYIYTSPVHVLRCDRSWSLFQLSVSCLPSPGYPPRTSFNRTFTTHTTTFDPSLLLPPRRRFHPNSERSPSRPMRHPVAFNVAPAQSPN